MQANRLAIQDLRSVVDPRFWLLLITTALVVIPYATGGLTFYYVDGRISIQPRIYMVFTFMLIAINIFAARPRYSPALIILLILLAVRLTDAVLLGRIPATSDVDPRSFAAGALIYAVSLSLITGDRSRLRLAGCFLALAVMVICSLLNAWEWRYPGSFSTVEGRSAGWLQNANDSATAIVSMLALALALRPARWIAVISIAIAGIGVYFTLSRSGAMVWIAVIMAFSALNLRQSTRAFLYVCILGAVAGLLVFTLVDFGTTLSTDRNVSSRQAQLIGRGAVDINDTSRMDLLLDGLQGIRARPLEGYGSYASYDVLYRPHNLVVAVWLDNGILGFLLLTASLGLLIRAAYRVGGDILIACVPLVGFLPFSQNLMENKSYLMVWVITAGMLSHKMTIAKRSVPQRAISPVYAVPRNPESVVS